MNKFDNPAAEIEAIEEHFFSRFQLFGRAQRLVAVEQVRGRSQRLHLSAKEIAERVGISYHTVRKAYDRLATNPAFRTERRENNRKAFFFVGLPLGEEN